MTTFELDENPCTLCPGNNERCSNIDPESKYNSLTCQLIIDWVMLKVPERVHKYRPRTALDNVRCRYCNGTSVGGRGTRQNIGYSVRILKCYKCGRRFSIGIDE